MADETLRSIYFAADETAAELDRLNRVRSDLIRTTRLALDTLCGRLGDSTLPFVDGSQTEAAGAPVAGNSGGRPTPVAPETPYVPLPQRTTHGGAFGPAVQRKLIAEALAKDTRW